MKIKTHHYILLFSSWKHISLISFISSLFYLHSFSTSLSISLSLSLSLSLCLFLSLSLSLSLSPFSLCLSLTVCLSPSLFSLFLPLSLYLSLSLTLSLSLSLTLSLSLSLSLSLLSPALSLFFVFLPRHEDDLSTIIAYSLASQEYNDRLQVRLILFLLEPCDIILFFILFRSDNLINILFSETLPSFMYFYLYFHFYIYIYIYIYIYFASIFIFIFIVSDTIFLSK